MDQEDEIEQSSDVFEFTAEKKIEYSNTKTGDFDETFTVYLRAPSYREKTYALKLQQHIYRAFAKAAEQRSDHQTDEAEQADGADQAEEEDEKMNGQRVMVLLSMFGDTEAVSTLFEGLVTKVGELETGVPLLAKHWRMLSLQDHRRMCGEYIANFIMPLVLSEMKGAFSES